MSENYSHQQKLESIHEARRRASEAVEEFTARNDYSGSLGTEFSGAKSRMAAAVHRFAQELEYDLKRHSNKLQEDGQQPENTIDYYRGVQVGVVEIPPQLTVQRGVWNRLSKSKRQQIRQELDVPPGEDPKIAAQSARQVPIAGIQGVIDWGASSREYSRWKVYKDSLGTHATKEHISADLPPNVWITANRMLNEFVEDQDLSMDRNVSEEATGDYSDLLDG